MTDREMILAALPDASPSSIVPPGSSTVLRPILSLETLFRDRFLFQGGQFIEKGDITAIGRSAYVDEDAWTICLGLGLERSGDPWEAAAGITLASCAVAETGSILELSGPERSRLASLCPPIHVVIIPRDRIVATLDEALTHLADRSAVLITGPSRTADIEGVMVRGVHGPGKLYACLT